MSTDTQARPSLSHLPLDVQLRIEVAETQGFEWASHPSGWWLENEAEEDTAVILWREPATPEWLEPDPLTDPAAWGALMEREGVWPEPVHAGDGTILGWEGNYLHLTGGGHVPPIYDRVPVSTSPGRAVCLAVLAKHGRDTSKYTDRG